MGNQQHAGASGESGRTGNIIVRTWFRWSVSRTGKSVFAIVAAAAMTVTSIVSIGLQPATAQATDDPTQTSETVTNEAENKPTEIDWFADEYGLPEGHVFESVTWERLQYILGYAAGGTEQNLENPDYPGGTFAIVLGGPENASSQAAVPLINEVAKDKGVEKVYHFDPRLDGDTLDITNTSLSATWTHLWTYPQEHNGLKERLGTIDPSYTSDSTYLLIYNKDHADQPILAGKVSAAESFDEQSAATYKDEIESVFDAAGSNEDGSPNIDVYPFIDYYQTRINNVRATKNADVGIPDSAKEDFTVQTITYPELIHLFESDGDFAILFGGTWCPYTTPTINTANTAALNQGVTKIYQFDFRLNGNSSDTGITSSSNDFNALYQRLRTVYLPNLTETVNGFGVPYFLEYDRSNTDAEGEFAPVVNEWNGYDPFGDYSYEYAWYQAAHLKEFLGEPDVRIKELDREVDPSVDNVLDDYDRDSGLNSATKAIPALSDFFENVYNHRHPVGDLYAEQPAGTPRAAAQPSENGGCGDEDSPIDSTVEDPILGQNGNDGYDVQNYDINISYDRPLGETWGGYSAETTVTAKASEDLSTVAFDLRDLKIGSVTVNDEEATYARNDNEDTDQYKLVVTPSTPISAGDTFKVTVHYYAFASSHYEFGDGFVQGFVPSSDSDGATAIGQPNGPGFWFPSNNNLTDRATYDVTLTAPSGLTGVSVGTLVSKESHGTLTTRHWQLTTEVLPYQVFASFGDYYEFTKNVRLSDGRTIPFIGYVAKSIYDEDRNSAAATAYEYASNIENYIGWIENKLGAYPYDSLGFVFENLNGATYSLETATRPIYHGVPEKTVFVHEFIHQWLGDSTSIATWEDLWLNEGFAVYLSNDYISETQDVTGSITDWYPQWFDTNSRDLFWNLAPAVPKNVNNLFGNGTYGRSAYALAALRSIVGDDVFFDITKTWATEYAGQSVATENFVSTAENVSEVDLSEWSQVWLYDEVKPAAWPTQQVETSLSDVSVSDVTASSAEVAATLTADGSPVSGATVEFYDGDLKLGEALTDSSGVATVTLSDLDAATEYSLIAKYAGDATHEASASASAVTFTTENAPVEPEEPDKAATALSDVTVSDVTSSSATVSATLTVDDSPVSGATVGFYDGDLKLGEALTNASGVATATLSDLDAAREYAVVGKYAGDDAHETSASASAVTFTTEESEEPVEPVEPGQSADTLAVRRGNRYYFKYSLSGGDADRVIAYGKPGDQVLVGDWDGDGVDTLAVRRGNTYYIKNSLSGGTADTVIAYGKAGDQVLVGDWNGDGKDTLAVRRGNAYHIKNSLSGGQADTVVAYGTASDQVLVGDWNGDGTDTLAVRRGKTYYFKDSISGGDADKVVVYGNAYDKVLVGDWDGDGADTLAVRRGKTYYFKNSLSGGTADKVIAYGGPYDQVFSGSWR